MIQYNGTTLAYIGDAIYEVLIRETLLEKGFTKVQDLHERAITYTSANGQAEAFDTIESFLTEEEYSIFKRGRNANTERKARNADLATYKKATGFEALIGYLYLSKKEERITFFLEKIIK